MSARHIDLAFHAPDAADAARQARDWARAEPRIRLRTIARIRRDHRPMGAPPTDRWIVTVAVSDVPA